VGVHFRDGALVRRGDVLFTLDGRQIEADIKRVEAVIAGAEAQLEQASRDVARYTELVARNATTLVTLNNAQTQVNVSRALAESNKATLESLKVQLSFCTIRAQITGRASMAAVKIGNFVRQADAAPLATIIQLAPIYVTFTVSQRSLQDIRQAVAEETATVEAFMPGAAKPATGQVTMIENSVDTATGMATIRATMPNTDEVLWPGTLVTAQLTLRIEDAVVVPTPAVQVSQTGSFVFVVKDGLARVQPVTVDRVVGFETVISSGLESGETVVTDGHLLLTNGARVTVRERKAGS
jgi:multidrug efflux system membrane fusion protein